LSIFVWGHTFLELNNSTLECYAAAHDSAEIIRIQNDLYHDAVFR